MINLSERIWERLAMLTGGFAPGAPSRFAVDSIDHEHLLEYASLLKRVTSKDDWSGLAAAALKKLVRV